jgi:hypothetical protein
MHWTALLERRFFPPHATIIDDVPCVGCGYNLRGTRAAGRCPECGLDAGPSLYVLRKPKVVADAGRSIARTHMAWFALLLCAAGIVMFSRGLLWLGLIAMVLASLVRVLATYELRFRATLENLPLIGMRLGLLWWLTLIELAVAVGACVTLFLSMAGPLSGKPWMPQALVAAGLSWAVVAIVMTLVTSLVGESLAMVLEYDFVVREFRIQRWLTVAGMLVAIPLALVGLLVANMAGSATVGGVLALLALGAIVLLWAIAGGFLVVGLLHLAGAAERETEIREDAVDRQPVASGLPRPPSRDDDLPDIEVEG